jgi:hypothetical protein
MHAGKAFSEYVAGTDTTEINGYSHDSLFGIKYSTMYFKAGCGSVAYSDDDGCFGQAFDDIVKAPDSLTTTFKGFRQGTTYVVKAGIYWKICIIQKLSDGRYIYRFGKNITPGEALLTAHPLDPSTRFKPNNLQWSAGYNIPTTTVYLKWERPLPGNNHLRGYLLYFSKVNASIDTSKPVNMAQWDSIVINDTVTNTLSTVSRGGYLNLVARYAEGKSEFLKGWSRLPLLIGTTVPEMHGSHQRPAGPSGYTIPGGYCIFLNGGSPAAVPRSIAAYSIAGRRVGMAPVLSGSRNMPVPCMLQNSPGCHIVNAAFPDGSTAAQQIMMLR